MVSALDSGVRTLFRTILLCSHNTTTRHENLSRSHSPKTREPCESLLYTKFILRDGVLGSKRISEVLSRASLKKSHYYTSHRNCHPFSTLFSLFKTLSAIPFHQDSRLSVEPWLQSLASFLWMIPTGKTARDCD